MKTYLIIIIDLATGTSHLIRRFDENIDETINKELGGWSNITSNGSSTSNRQIDDINYQNCGTTKDRYKMFSILCYNDTLNP